MSVTRCAGTLGRHLGYKGVEPACVRDRMAPPGPDVTEPIHAADRLHSLDALRAFGLLLGIFFHAAAGYVENFPAGFWPWREPSSATLGVYFFVSHTSRTPRTGCT